MLFHTVVFATDFSDSSRRAGAFASSIAKRFGAELLLVHAFALSQAAAEAEALSQANSAQRGDLQQALVDAAAELTNTGAVPILREGSPEDVVRDVAAAHESPLVVLGTHGGGAVERRLIGSAAEAILRSSAVPVLTVGPHVAPPAQSLAFRHILYATSFSAGALASAREAFVLADEFGADIDLLHVGGDAGPDAWDRLVPSRQERQGAVRKFAAGGDVTDAIVQHAASHGIDLVVLGVHPHSTLARHLRTGPAFQVILQAICPVLTVPPELP